MKNYKEQKAFLFLFETRLQKESIVRLFAMFYHLQSPLKRIPLIFLYSAL